MAVVLAYVDAVPGRLYPLVPTLELTRRGHRRHRGRHRPRRTPARAGPHRSPRAADRAVRARRLEGPHPLRRPHVGARPVRRARPRPGDRSRRAIESDQPDALFIDEGSWGAAAAAERSGLPWAFSLVSPVPLTSRDAPPFGLGLGHATTRSADCATVSHAADARVARAHRRPRGQRPPCRARRAAVHDHRRVYLAAYAVLAYTAEPFEYPRSHWPPKLTSSGPASGNRRPTPRRWLDDLQAGRSCSSPARPCSRTTDASPTSPAGLLRGQPSTSSSRPPTSTPPASPTAANVRVERFVPHAPVLDRAACVVCHAGMGITQKALAHGVPVVAVPFGRDQPEVARRVEVAGAGIRLPARKLRAEPLRGAVRRAVSLRPGAERIAAAFATAGGAVVAANEVEGLILDRAPAAETASHGRRLQKAPSTEAPQS